MHTLRSFLLTLALVGIFQPCASLPAQSGAGASSKIPPAQARLGMNLSSISDFGAELHLVDVFKSSRRWISQAKGAAYGKGPELDLDEDGWVRSLPEGAFVEALMCTDLGGRYPGGQYTVLYEGKGRLGFARDAKLVSEEPGRAVIEVTPKGGFSLQILATDPADPVRNIRVIMPGFEETYQTQVFHPVFLARWRGMAVIRFMDWMRTNGSAQQKWSDRPKMTDAIWTTKGAPAELMIDLANRLKIDPWFCMPHLADDDYVREFARLVKAKLDPSLKAHVELSNEVWNSMFAQTKHAQAKALELGLGEPKRPWEGGAWYHAQRSVEVFRIWEEVFGGRERLVRVIAWQAGSGADWTDGRLLAKTGGAADVDVLAIAPYFSFNVPGKSPREGALTADVVSTWTVEQVLDHVEKVELPKSIEEMKRHKAVADKYGVRLMCYEAGQHLVGVTGGENNNELTKLFIAANRHPRMGELYRRYINGWKEAGGDVMAIFSSVGLPSKWGSWGIAEHHEQRPAEAPKYRAVLESAKALGQKVEFDPWKANPVVGAR